MISFRKFWSKPRPEDSESPVFVPDIPRIEPKPVERSVMQTKLNLAISQVARDLPVGWRLVVSFERFEEEVEVVVEIVGPNQTRYVITATDDPTLHALLLTALDEIQKRKI